MPIDTTWSNPTSLARGSGQSFPYSYYEDLASDVNVLGGSDGNSKTGPYYIDHGTDDAHGLRLLSTGDVAHGVTGYAPTAVYAAFGKHAGTTGGLHIVGIAESAVETGIQVTGIAGTDATGKNTTAGAYMVVEARKISGTSTTDPGAGANVFIARSDDVNKFIVDQEGDLHVDGSTSLTAFDAYDDALLVRAAARELTPVGLLRDAYDEFVRYGRRDLEAAGLVRFNEATDGRPYVNLTGFVRLLCGAVWQLQKQLYQLEARP